MFVVYVWNRAGRDNMSEQMNTCRKGLCLSMRFPLWRTRGWQGEEWAARMAACVWSWCWYSGLGWGGGGNTCSDAGMTGKSSGS